MKQTFTVIILLMVFICAMAQDSINDKIIFDKTVHDFGIIDKGSKAECVFSFINKSQTPVAVTRVEASCGCTVPTWSKEPVKPNNSGEIKVKYNTNITGLFVKTITIFTTLDKEPLTLTVKGEVKKKGKRSN